MSLLHLRSQISGFTVFDDDDQLVNTKHQLYVDADSVRSKVFDLRCSDQMFLTQLIAADCACFSQLVETQVFIFPDIAA